MPESRSRKKPDRGRGRSSHDSGPRPPGLLKRWAAPAMLTCWLLGLFWVVVYYVAGTRIPVMDDLGGYNLLGGMGLIAAGFVFATQWE